MVLTSGRGFINDLCKTHAVAMVGHAYIKLHHIDRDRHETITQNVALVCARCPLKLFCPKPLNGRICEVRKPNRLVNSGRPVKSGVGR